MQTFRPNEPLHLTAAAKRLLWVHALRTAAAGERGVRRQKTRLRHGRVSSNKYYGGRMTGTAPLFGPRNPRKGILL